MGTIANFVEKIVMVYFTQSGDDVPTETGTLIGVLEKDEDNIVRIRDTETGSLFLVPKKQKCVITNIIPITN